MLFQKKIKADQLDYTNVKYNYLLQKLLLSRKTIFQLGIDGHIVFVNMQVYHIHTSESDIFQNSSVIKKLIAIKHQK